MAEFIVKVEIEREDSFPLNTDLDKSMVVVALRNLLMDSEMHNGYHVTKVPDVWVPQY